MTDRTIATVRDYGELLDALRKRSAAMAVSRKSLDALAGIADGHASKLLAPVPLKVFGMASLGPVLAVLGLKIVVIEDAEALAKIQKRITPRMASADHASDALLPKWRRRKRGFRGLEASRLMNAHRHLKLSPKRRAEIARKAARARWSKARRAPPADRARGTSAATTRRSAAPAAQPLAAGIAAATCRARRR